MKHAIPWKRLQHTIHDDKKRGIADDDENEDFSIVLRANNNMIKNEIKCVYRLKNDRKIDGFLAHFWSRDFRIELCVK